MAHQFKCIFGVCNECPPPFLLGFLYLSGSNLLLNFDKNREEKNEMQTKTDKMRIFVYK